MEEQGPLGPVYALEVEQSLELFLFADAFEGFLVALHVHEAARFGVPLHGMTRGGLGLGAASNRSTSMTAARVLGQLRYLLWAQLQPEVDPQLRHL